nr:hypothetical protein [Tanacetum cinerariifolium]
MYLRLDVVDDWTGGNVDIKDGVSVNILGEPLSPDYVFDFPVDEPEPHPAYDFFAPGLLPGYADEPMVEPIVDEIAEPIVETEEQMIALVIDAEEDIAMLFEDDDFSDKDSEGVEEEPPSVYKVGGPSTAAAEGQSFPLPAHGLLVPPSVIEDLSTRLAGVFIREIVTRVFTIEGQGQQTATQKDKEIARLTHQVQALYAAVQQRHTQIQQLQTMVSEMSSRESTLMQRILGMDRRLAELKRRPPGSQ